METINLLSNPDCIWKTNNQFLIYPGYNTSFNIWNDQLSFSPTFFDSNEMNLEINAPTNVSNVFGAIPMIEGSCNAIVTIYEETFETNENENECFSNSIGNLINSDDSLNSQSIVLESKVLS